MDNHFQKEIQILKNEAEELENSENAELIKKILNLIEKMENNMNAYYKDLEEYIDSVDGDLSEFKTDVYGIDEDIKNETFDEESDNTKYIQIKCVKCGEEIYMDEALIKSHAKIECPICHAVIEL